MSVVFTYNAGNPYGSGPGWLVQATALDAGLSPTYYGPLVFDSATYNAASPPDNANSLVEYHGGFADTTYFLATSAHSWATATATLKMVPWTGNSYDSTSFGPVLGVSSASSLVPSASPSVTPSATPTPGASATATPAPVVTDAPASSTVGGLNAAQVFGLQMAYDPLINYATLLVIGAILLRFARKAFR